jgi:hypothetical protein
MFRFIHPNEERMLNRLIANWVYGVFLAGLLLLLLAPVVVHGWPPALVATFLCLPVYMLHQYKEHDNNRFRLFINRIVGQGQEVLSPLAVLSDDAVLSVRTLQGSQHCDARLPTHLPHPLFD